MGRKGTGGAIRISARLSNTPELLGSELKGVLPTGVTEDDNNFIFPGGVEVAKSGLANIEGKIHSANPFEITIYDKNGEELQDEFFNTYGSDLPVTLWSYDPEAKQLIVDAATVKLPHAIGGGYVAHISRTTIHENSGHNFNFTDRDLDRFIKGYYNPFNNTIGAITRERYLPKNWRQRNLTDEEIDFAQIDASLKTANMLKRYFKPTTSILVGSMISVESVSNPAWYRKRTLEERDIVLGLQRGKYKTYHKLTTLDDVNNFV